MPFPFLPLLAGGVIGGMGSAMINSQGMQGANAQNVAMQRETNAQNLQIGKDQMRFQEEMSNTAYRRAMNDMKHAGLNPMLAFSQGGASSPGGASPTMGSPTVENAAPNFSEAIGNAVSSALEARRLKKDIAETDSRIALNAAGESAAYQQAKLNEANAKMAGMNFKVLDKQFPAIAERAHADFHRAKWDAKSADFDAIVSRWNAVAGAASNSVNVLGPLLGPLLKGRGKVGGLGGVLP